MAVAEFRNQLAAIGRKFSFVYGLHAGVEVQERPITGLRGLGEVAGYKGAINGRSNRSANGEILPNVGLRPISRFVMYIGQQYQ